MTLQAVTFDLWDTLVYNKNYSHIRIPELDRVLKAHGIMLSEEALNEAYLSGFRYSSRVIPAEGHRHVETHEIVSKVLETAGCTSREALNELVTIYEEAILRDPPQLKESAHEALDYAKRRYEIGLISVTGVSPGRVIRRILSEYGILEYFDALTFSDEVKLVKPNTGLFNACLKELQVAPENAVHVGDSFKSDIVGAIDAGMRTIWVKTREQDQPQGYVPDQIISSLLEFPEALRTLE